MNNFTLGICVCVIVVASSVNPYIKKTVVNTNNDVSIPFELFYIFVSFVSAAIISYVLFFYKKDWIYLLFGVIITLMAFMLCMYKIYDKEYTNAMYLKMIASAFLSVIPSFIFLFLITKHDISYLDPIIKPLILILIFVLGITVFGETKQNTMTKWLCITGIVILIGVFTSKKTNLNGSSTK